MPKYVLYMLLFTNKMSMFDEITLLNASKLALFLEYENICVFFRFSFHGFSP